MNVNLSAVTNALNFIDRNYNVGDDAEVTLDVSSKVNNDYTQELKLQITLLSAWNYKEEKVFMLTLERRYEEKEKPQAVSLYSHMTTGNADWRKKQAARVILIDDVCKFSNYSIVKISCSSINIEGIKNIVLDVFKFMYSDDKMRRLYVKLTDLDRKFEKKFIPSRKFLSMKNKFSTPEICLN